MLEKLSSTFTVSHSGNQYFFILYAGLLYVTYTAYRPIALYCMHCEKQVNACDI